MAIYAMICWSAIIGQRVIILLLFWGLYLTGEQLGKFSTTNTCSTNTLRSLDTWRNMKKDDFEPSKQRASSAWPFYNVR